MTTIFLFLLHIIEFLTLSIKTLSFIEFLFLSFWTASQTPFHDPTSNHLKFTGTTTAFLVFSIIALSKGIFLKFLKMFSGKTLKIISSFTLSKIFNAKLDVFGEWILDSLNKLFPENKKIPLFQKEFLDLIKLLAFFIAGFSIKFLIIKAIPIFFFPEIIYPIEVLGLFGLIPKVVIKPWLTILIELRIIFINSFSSLIIWSAGRTNILALGSFFIISRVHIVIEAIVFFLIGSRKIEL